jgi:acyl homoserine lactone synthase
LVSRSHARFRAFEHAVQRRDSQISCGGTNSNTEAKMIISFRGSDRPHFPRETDQMFRLRANVFAHRLGWDVKVRDGWEIDEFDDLNPLYILSVDKSVVMGCLRLLPTTGPTLLRGPLSFLFDDSVDIRSPLIFECTRLATNPGVQSSSVGGVSRTMLELLAATCQNMMNAGILQVLGVIDERTLPIYRLAGWAPTIVARSRKDPTIIAALWEVRQEVLERLTATIGWKLE